MIVADTNVMVYLLTGSGPWERAAARLREDPEWAAPPILLSEIRNVVVGLVRRGQLSSADAVGVCEDAEAVLAGRVASPSTADVLDVALSGGISAYDAEFVALARRLGVPLVTADAAILEAAPEVAVVM